MQEIILIPFADALEKVGIKKTQAYQRINAGTFPQPVRVGGRSLFVASEIQDWIVKQMTQRGLRKIHARKADKKS
jgi:prophage regulatory protein